MSQPNDPGRPEQSEGAAGGAPQPPQYPAAGGEQPPQPPSAPEQQGPPPQYPAGGEQQAPPPSGQGQYPSDSGEAGAQQPPPGQGQYPQFPAHAGEGYQYTPQPGFYYDPESQLELPDGTALATNARRLGGYFMEVLLIIVTLFIGWLVWSLIVWAKGLTPAKQVLGMRCYRKVDRRPATWGWMGMRQFVGGLVEGIIPFGIIVSGIVMLVSNQRMMIHDHLAGTVVLYDPDKRLEAFLQ